MDILILAALVAAGTYMIKAAQQGRRILLLASHLGKYQIEKRMETLTQGYLRGLAEDDLVRRAQIWDLLAPTEAGLCSQFGTFAAEFSRVDPAKTRVSLLPVAVPFADQLFAQATFDLREAFAIHSRGIASAVSNVAGRSAKDKAFTVTAEMLLMQHTCHWFCKSKNVASARMLARHQTTHAQLVESVSPETRSAYCILTRQMVVRQRR